MILETDIGPLSLGYVNDSIMCEFGRHQVEREPTKKLARELLAYFEGKEIHTFSVKTPTAPPFTKKCWEACRSIPYGETISYKELATRAGSPNAFRAAGQAMRHNPISIITPCHRVLSSDGALHGYASETAIKSKELKRKQFLLELEQRTIRQ